MGVTNEIPCFSKNRVSSAAFCSNCIPPVQNCKLDIENDNTVFLAGERVKNYDIIHDLENLQTSW